MFSKASIQSQRISSRALKPEASVIKGFPSVRATRQRPTGTASPFPSPLSGSASSPRSCIIIAHGFGFGAKKASDAKTCDCGSKVPYEECCEPFHLGAQLPPTAEKLMRSRYTAYCRGLKHYIVETTHRDNPAQQGSISPDGKIKTTLLADVEATIRTCKFEKLKASGKCLAGP